MLKGYTPLPFLSLSSSLRVKGKGQRSRCHKHTGWASQVAAAAKSLQSCPTLCNPIDSSPPGSAIPGILQARTLEWAAVSFSSQGALEVKNPPANAGDVRDEDQSLGREDPLEDGMATHSTILAWRFPWTEEPGGLQSMGSQRVRHYWGNLAHKYTSRCCKVTNFSELTG